jgi:hypothetical protein
MAKPTVQSRVDPNVKERIRDFAEENEMSQSEAVRHLLRDGIDAEAEQDPTQSTLYAVALTAAVYLVAIPTAAEYLLLGAAAVFAIDGVVGYAKEANRLIPKIVEYVADRGPGDADDTATAAMSPGARLVGGGLMLLALAWIAVSAVV